MLKHESRHDTCRAIDTARPDFAKVAGSSNSDTDMKQRITRIVTLIAAIAGLTQMDIASAQDETSATPEWSVAPASEVADASAIAKHNKERILVWNRPKGLEPAAAAYLLIDAPFAQVQPAVQKALADFGRFETRSGANPLRVHFEFWDKVLLSRRPDLRDAIAERVVRPQLQLALREGALTQEEVDRRMAAARASITTSITNLDDLEEFRQTYSTYSASQKRRFGLSRDTGSELRVNVFDVSATFGHPATAVKIDRQDAFANPALKVKREFNVLRTIAPTVLTGTVPAPLFEATRSALEALPGGESVQVALNPKVWIKPIEPTQSSALTRGLVLTPPQADRPPIQAEVLRWESIAELREDDFAFPHDLLTLPDGDLMVRADNAGATRVWRLHRDGERWQADLVWQGNYGRRRLSISADGRTVWFAATPTGEQEEQLFSYRVDTQQVTAYSPTRTNDDDSWSYWSMELDGQQRPTFFDDDSLRNPSTPLGRRWFEGFQPSGEAPESGGPWPFRRAFAPIRQSVMSDRIRPVRWRGGSFWTEDSRGIAELDGSTGSVLRSQASPLRYGPPDGSEDEPASGVPTALGSEEGHWIAVGFMMLLHDEGRLPPKLDGKPDGNDRFVGMHVIDVDDGRVRVSALLGQSDSLKAAARSANGRWLALASRNLHDRTQTAALWEIGESGRSLRLNSATSYEASSLAFSWSGNEVWAMCRYGLLHWRLPDELKDPARQGSFPEQSQSY